MRTIESPPSNTKRTALVVATLVAITATGALVGTGAANEIPGLSMEAEGDTTETTVVLEPADETVHVGETTTYDVVVEQADGGVGAYNFTVSARSGAVASLRDVSLESNPDVQKTDVTYASDNTSVQAVAALSDTRDSGRVTIATVTVAGEAAGTSDLQLTVTALGTESGQSYEVTGTRDSSITVEERGPANFRVSTISAPASTTRGDRFDVSAVVENTGEREGTRTVEFRLDLDSDGRLSVDETVASLDVTLPPAESTIVTFAGLDTSSLDTGKYQAAVVVDGSRRTTAFTVDPPQDDRERDDDDDEDDDVDSADVQAAFALEATIQARTIDVGETITVNVTIQNSGEKEGTMEVGLALDGEPTQTSQTVELGPGEETVFTLEQTVSEAGDYAVEVAGVDLGTVTVREVTGQGTPGQRVTPADTPEPGPETTPEPEDTPGSSEQEDAPSEITPDKDVATQSAVSTVEEELGGFSALPFVFAIVMIVAVATAAIYLRR